MQITEEIKESIKKHALEEFPNECCGLIINNDNNIKALRCKNISDYPTEHFIINPKDYLRAESIGKIIAYYHSHSNNNPDFSKADIIVSENSKIPAILFTNNELKTYNPKNIKTPYEGRPFQPYFFDCFSLVKDYYSRELNINLTELKCQEREEISKWPNVSYNNSSNFTLKNHFLSNNFIEIKGKYKKHDILLCRPLGIKCASHCIIYLGNNMVLHQLLNSISKKELLLEYWKNRIVNIMRHNTLI